MFKVMDKDCGRHFLHALTKMVRPTCQIYGRRFKEQSSTGQPATPVAVASILVHM